MESAKHYGFTQGLKEGENISKKKIAKSMLEKEMDINAISDITGLSKEEIEELK